MTRHLARILAGTLCAAAAAAQAQSSADIALPGPELATQQGRVVLHEDAAHHVRTIRATLPPNKDLQPHGPDQGYFIVTVISGTLELGFGTEFDAARLQTLPPGSVFTHPVSQKHFARTGAEPVVLQITSIQPD